MRPDPDYIETASSGDREVALLAAEVRRLKALIAASEPMLTDAEREAVQAAIDSCDSGADFNDQRIWPALAKRLRARSVTLRSLLERIGGAE